jgi:hypothetical protein
MLALVGCTTPYSEVPIAANFKTSSQAKLQAAGHWSLISEDLSKKLQENMAQKVDKTNAIYIFATNYAPFNQAVVDELISSLISNGYNIVKRPNDAIKIDVNTQVLQFSPNRLQAKSIGIPTLITTGLWTSAEIGSITGAGVATAAIAGSEALAYMNSDRASGPTPKTEIIVDITVSNEINYIAKSRGTYYVADTDTWLYQAAQTKKFSVQGEQ